MGFQNCTDTSTGTPLQTTNGVNFSALANNVDSSVVAVVAALAHDVHYIIIGVGGIGVSTGNGQALMDFMSDPAGGTSWGSFIDDLPVGFSGSISNETIFPIWYHFPVWVKAGTSFGVRARTAHTSDLTAGQIAVYAFGDPKRPDMWWCGQKVETIGATAASSTGTSITAGSTGTFGSWTTVGTTGGRYGAVQMGFCGTDATAASVGYHFQIGMGSQKLPGSPNHHLVVTTGERMGRAFHGPIWCDIPSGTTVQARGTATAGTIEAMFVTAHGVI